MAYLDDLDEKVSNALDITESLLERTAQTQDYEPLLAPLVHLGCVSLALSMKQARLLQQILENLEGQTDG